ncbi:MAG: DivIVA domain-containing protein, partial [Clostridia bacterium]|nr:DivIVA domain-containing protein [Clostridia bacterium]
MISAEEIRNKHFSKAGMSGYKKIEVDVFLDEIVNTINYLTATQAANEKKIADYELKLNEYKNDEQAIQSALVNAQRVSDNLVSEAKKTAEDIVFKANAEAEKLLSDATLESQNMLDESKEKADLILTEAQTLSKNLSETTEKLTTESVENANRRAEAITAAAENAVAEQQSLFDALRLQVTMFKRDMEAQLNGQLELINAMPDEVKRDPLLAAKLAAETIEEEIYQEEPEADEPEETSNDIERIISEMKSNEAEAAEFIAETSVNNADELNELEELSETDELDELQDLEKLEEDESDDEPKKTTTSSFTVCLDFDDDEEDELDEDDQP